MSDRLSFQAPQPFVLPASTSARGPSRAVCRESGGNFVKTALVSRSHHAAHRSALVGGHDHAMPDARRAGASDRRRFATADAERSVRSPTPVAATPSAGGYPLPPAHPAQRTRSIQMRPLPHLRGTDRFWRPAPQSLPLVPDVTSRRSAPARGSIEPVSSVDGSNWRCLSA